MKKNFKSRYFEDYELNEEINHSVPRTITDGDVSIYLSTTGSRFPLNYSAEFSKTLGLKKIPIDDIFNVNVYRLFTYLGRCITLVHRDYVQKFQKIVTIM